MSTMKICTNSKTLFSFDSIFVCVYKFVWLYNFFLKSCWKKNKIANNLSPGKCVLQSSLRDEVHIEKVFSCKQTNYGLGLSLVN